LKNKQKSIIGQAENCVKGLGVLRVFVKM